MSYDNDDEEDSVEVLVTEAMVRIMAVEQLLIKKRIFTQDELKKEIDIVLSELDKQEGLKAPTNQKKPVRN